MQVRKTFLHRQTIEWLIEKVCSSQTSESCWVSAEEEAYVRQEVAKLDFMLQEKGESNIRDTFIFKKGVVNWDHMSDIWYKRILTDVLLKRERQVAYLSSHVEQTKEPKLRLTRSRFADSEDPMPLILSFSIGSVLLVAINYGLSSSIKTEE